MRRRRSSFWQTLPLSHTEARSAFDGVLFRGPRPISIMFYPSFVSVRCEAVQGFERSTAAGQIVHTRAIKLDVYYRC